MTCGALCNTRELDMRSAAAGPLVAEVAELQRRLQAAGCGEARMQHQPDQATVQQLKAATDTIRRLEEEKEDLQQVAEPCDTDCSIFPRSASLSMLAFRQFMRKSSCKGQGQPSHCEGTCPGALYKLLQGHSKQR